MKKGILVVSFGCSIKETRDKCIKSIENRIESTYADYEVWRAFTSNIIIKKLKKQGICIDTPTEALEKMIEAGYDEIIVQPLHILQGYEYEKVKNSVLEIKNESNISIVMGSSLLNDEESYDLVIDALMSKLPKENKNEGILLMGHGTSHFSNACYSMLQNKLNEKREDIVIANVEGYPEIEQTIGNIESKFSKMTLLPFMIVAGDHAINDMAGEENSFKTLLEEKNIEVNCILEGLGENSLIQDIFVQKIFKSIY